MKHQREAVGALGALLRELGLPASLMSLLLAHAHAVAADADRLGLVSAGETPGIIARHTADSLLFALARSPSPDERWADVGSGAGFPGIVLACCYPHTSFLLIEPQRRRAGFLEAQRARLGLDNVEVVPARAETVEPGFDVVVARALAEPLLALEALLRLAGRDGTALLAVGSTASAPPGVDLVEVPRPGVDSPGRFLMMTRSLGGA